MEKCLSPTKLVRRRSGALGEKWFSSPQGGQASGGERSVPLSWLGDDQVLWGKNGASPQGGQASGGRLDATCKDT